MRDRWTYALAVVSAATGIGALVCAGEAGEMHDHVITVVHPWVVYSLMIAGLSSSTAYLVLLVRRSCSEVKWAAAISRPSRRSSSSAGLP